MPTETKHQQDNSTETKHQQDNSIETKHQEDNSIESHHQFLVIDTLLAGAFAGLVRDSLLYPIEAYQFARHLDVKVTLSVFHKGLIPAVIGALPSAAAFITTYSTMKVYLSPYFTHERQYLGHMMSAAAAESMNMVFKVPMDNIKKRQVILRNYVSIFGVTKRLHRAAGLGAFYRGFPPAIASRIAMTLITLPLWENLMNRVKEIEQVDHLSPFAISMCGALSAGVGAAVTTPLHVAKTLYVFEEIKEMEKEMTEKMELQRIARELKRKRLKIIPKNISRLKQFGTKMITSQQKVNLHMTQFAKILVRLYQQKGVPGLYTGWWARSSHYILGGALFFYSYAFVMQELEDIDKHVAVCVGEHVAHPEHKKRHPKCENTSKTELAVAIVKVRRADVSRHRQREVAWYKRKVIEVEGGEVDHQPEVSNSQDPEQESSDESTTDKEIESLTGSGLVAKCKQWWFQRK